jgi:iron complex transport system substrate-binding protein
MRKHMKNLIVTVCLAAMAIMIMTGCGSKQTQIQTPPESASVTNSASPAASASAAAGSSASAQQYPAAGSVMQLKYAKNFKVEYLDNGMKLVTDGQGKQILLLQDGQTAPEKYAELPSLTIPLTKVIYTSTTQVGYLRAFNDDSLFDSIVGVRATADDWDFDAMKSRMESKKIVDIGSNTTMSVSYDYEIIQSLQPNVVFTNAGMSSEQTKLMTMLDQAGIKYIFDGSSSEADYRGVMEWVKFYAAFYNLDTQAGDYFDKAMARIDNIISVTSKIPDSERVKVGWGIVTGGKIYVENGGSKSAQMVRDCGGKYIFDDIGAGKVGVSELTAEEFYSRMSTADVFINRGMPKYGPDIDSILEQFPTLADIGSLKEGKILQIKDSFWSTYHNIDEDYIEMSEFFYPDKFDTTTPDKFTQFLIMPQTAK